MSDPVHTVYPLVIYQDQANPYPLNLTHSSSDSPITDLFLRRVPPKIEVFLGQIFPAADLSLRVFIPLGRLFTPIGLSNLLDLSDFSDLLDLSDFSDLLDLSDFSDLLDLSNLSDLSDLSKDTEYFLRHFSKSNDLENLTSIVNILESDSFKAHERQSLLTLSRYFEALSVLKGSLTNSYWNLYEDKITLTIWNMLSYYSHAQEHFSTTYPDLISAIDKKLSRALADNAYLFRLILETEEIKEQLEYLKFEKIKEQVNKFYILSCQEDIEESPSDSSDERNWDIKLFLSISRGNFYECKAINKIKKHRLLSTKEKLNQAMQIWDDLSCQAPTLKIQTLKSEEITTLDDIIKKLTTSAKVKVQQITLYTFPLTEVKRMIQGLYELEHLKIAATVSESLLQNTTYSQEAIIQWLVLIRESFKVVLSEEVLNISASKSIQPISSLIRDLRDYYEHPEQYDFYADENKKIELETELFSEIYKMRSKIKQFINKRIEKIEQILRPKDNKSVQDILTALALRNIQEPKDLKQKDLQKNSQEQKDLKKQREVQADLQQNLQEQYPASHSFQQKITKRKQNIEQKSSEPSFIPHNSTRADISHSLEHTLRGLDAEVSTLKRCDLEKKLETNLPFRLAIQRKISTSYRLLEQLKKNVNFDFVDPANKELFETIYQSTKNYRNFQTHDLWKENTHGIINTAYLLTHDLLNLIPNLYSTPVPYPEDSTQYQIWGMASAGNLDEKTLNEALENGFDVNYYDYKLRSLLHFLALNPTNQNLRLAKLIIQKGARVFHADNEQARPLHYAAESGFIELARILVEHGAAVDAVSKGRTPMMIAQRLNHPEIAQYLAERMGIQRSSNIKALLDAVGNLDVTKVRELIARGFDPKASFEGHLPLVSLFDRELRHDEAQKRADQIAIAQALIQANADINQPSPEYGETALHTAANNTDNIDVINYLMSLQPNINIQDFSKRTPFENAIACQHKNWAKAFRKVAQDSNQPKIVEYLELMIIPTSNIQALLDAVDNLDITKVRELIAGNFDPKASFKGRLPLVSLFNNRKVQCHTQIEIAKLLIQANADINQPSPEHGETALHTATNRTDNIDVINYLMSLHPNLNIQDFAKRTPLHKAAASRYKNWVKALLEAGALVNVEDKNGDTPLVSLFNNRKVQCHTQIEIAKLLIQANADINQRSPTSGKTVLHTATNRTDNIDVINYLMSLHPNLNIQDFAKRTPLHNAAASRHKNWVKALLEAGALVNVKDNNGNTPLLIVSKKFSSNNPEHPAYRIIVQALGKRALHNLAKTSGWEEIASVLVRGASPFILRRGGIYYRNMPYQLSNNDEVICYLFESMKYLFSHITAEDQSTLLDSYSR